MSELRIHPLAEAELGAAARFYEAQLGGLGEAFLVEVGRCFARARQSPDLGAPCYGRFRRLLVRRFPYAVVYEVLPDSVLIVAVAHQRRKPGYWRRRY
ncbi:MAG: type II toxin-antitoxin system RelE/ParE family toxin [Thermodesulfobacteriota bacterium]